MCFEKFFASMKFMSENETEIEKNSKVYELGYLLVPTIAQDDVPVNYGNLKELIVSFGGEIISDEMPKITNLAYSISKITSNVRSKFTTAYFGWIKFTISAPKVLELKKALDLDPKIIRFLILKTVKENTIAAKRFVRGEIYKRPAMKKSAENETVTPINKEEIDKEIDAMVAA